MGPVERWHRLRRTIEKDRRKADRRAVLSEERRERFARMHADRRETSVEQNCRQIRAILEFPSISGLNRLTQFRDDRRQPDEVRADAAAAILRIAFGKAQIGELDDPGT